MGWTWQHRAPGISNRDFFAELMGSRYEIVECATVDRDEFYAATRRSDGLVDCFVAKLCWSPRSEYNFGYKDMSESMGPAIASCPRRVLDVLSPLEVLYPWDGEGDRPYAYDWRERCLASAERAAIARAVKPGDRLILPEPVTFADDVSESEFVFVGRSLVRRAGDNRLCQLTGWRKTDFTHVPKEG